MSNQQADGDSAIAYEGIRISHEGKSFTVFPRDEVTFGRSSNGNIALGQLDRHVHRRAGSFRWISNRWEIHNDGDRTSLLIEIAGGLEGRVSVGAHAFVLPWGAVGQLRLLTPTPYVIDFATATSSDPAETVEVITAEDGSTLEPRVGLGLNDTEVKMLVALCEPRLRDPRLPAFTIPSTKDLCARLDVGPKKVEDVVDSLVVKLAPYVDGVIGTNDGRAVNRRHRIAAFAIDTRCVTARDLRLLERTA